MGFDLRRHALSAAVRLVSIGALVGCVEIDKPIERQPIWEGEIQLISNRRCAECHGSESARPLQSFADWVKCESGSRVASEGALAVLARADHRGVVPDDELSELRGWIGSGLTFQSTLGHELGWNDPSSTSFHGRSLRRDGYRSLLPGAERPCAGCHEAGRPGGAVPCSTCHSNSFEDQGCVGCHRTSNPTDPDPAGCFGGDEAASARTHLVHTAPPGPSYRPVECSTCHEVPTRLSGPGHFDASPGAEVRITEPASQYDPTQQTCSVPSCHGASVMEWVAPPSTERECARCHGNPPEGHANDACASCHVKAYVDLQGPKAQTHLDGFVDVGKECRDCHRDLDEGLPNSELLSSLHQTHIRGAKYSDGMTCETCHKMPADRDDPGHINSAPPVEVSLVAGSAQFDRETMSCADVSCHGAKLDGGSSRVEWKVPAFDLECSGCHELPPQTVRAGAAEHFPTGNGWCGACHRTPTGEPITIGTSSISWAGLSVHVGGCVDLGEGCAHE